MRPLIQLEAESRIRLRSSSGGAAAADSSRLMGVDRLGRRSGGDCLRLRLRSCWLLQRPENDATRVSRSAVGRYARQWWLGIISLDAMSGLGTVQRCHNPVVMPPLHGPRRLASARQLEHLYICVKRR